MAVSPAGATATLVADIPAGGVLAKTISGRWVGPATMAFSGGPTESSSPCADTEYLWTAGTITPVPLIGPLDRFHVGASREGVLYGYPYSSAQCESGTGASDLVSLTAPDWHATTIGPVGPARAEGVATTPGWTVAGAWGRQG